MWTFKLAPNYTGAANSTGCVYWIYKERVLELMTLKSLISWFAFNLFNTRDLTVAKILANSEQVDLQLSNTEFSSSWALEYEFISRSNTY